MSTETPRRRSRLRWIPVRSGRSKVVAGLTALVVPLAAMVGLASPAAAAATATATYTKKSDWGSGFEGQWTVKNTGTTALSSWTIEWDFPSGTAAGSAWDANLTKSGNHYTAKNLSWNGTVAPGASISFGFNGTGSGSPTGCKLNGASCDGGPNVPGDNPPSAPGTPTTSDVTNTSVKLSWSAATDDKGVKNYDVLRDGAKVATVTGTTYTNTGLTAGTDYSYAVQARDTADQTGPASGSVSVRTTGGGGGEQPGGDKVNLGYFTNWGVYGRNYHVKNLVTSGSAAKITHINYAFGNVQNGKCTIGDSYADYEKAYTADQSVDGVADTWDQPLRGNFNQLRKLKAKYPHIKILWSFGGWTWSGGFGQAVQNPAAFAQSCYDLVEDPRWASQSFDWYNVMTYDFFGAWAAKGPTAPHSPLTPYAGIPQAGFSTSEAIAKLKAKGVPAKKLLLGIGFYGRGWTGVTQSAPGGTATGAAPGTYEAGNEDYKVLKNTCPSTGTIAGTAYAHCGSNWWSYDTPATIGTKMTWAKNQGLGGAFFWEFSGDTANGELVTAMDSGLK
ncbi:glycosyl hydrolase family 18 protein [Streptomyces sp. NRRL B-1381]|uniref:glycosyl hydrolase family 18 protein n=1 Tax=Streptomyces sp. NRRL B-1381 TaxID=1463829 RepID=UPI0004C29808|nr:glycosyl hydrolase family 18 protein [Streptomyces sp. NRRL B-1381]